MSEPTIHDIMNAYAQDAVDFAQSNFGITLDYTAGSVQEIEKIAHVLFEERPRNFLSKIFKKGPSEEDVQTMSKMLGGYIGEIYRRSKGGEWDCNEEFQTIGIKRGDSWIFPPAKVYKRLTNGSEDDLWSYFSVITSEDFLKS